MKSRSLPEQVEFALPADCNSILVAVSGGVDSVVLLHCLCQLRKRLALDLRVVHLDHQIRAEGRSDAEFVSSLCARLQVPCHSEAADVPGAAKAHKQSLEMAGRYARRQLFQQLAHEHACQLVALAHHQDDQIETFMLRLVRGSGLTGLAAMKAHQGIWWRPLLASTREQILAYAREHQLQWVEDGSNRDPVYLRNRMRHQVLPLLRQLNPAFNDRTAELVSQLREDDDYWAQQVADQFKHFVVNRDDGLRLARGSLLQVHPALRMRIVREALLRVRGGLVGIESSHLRAVVALLVSDRSQAQLDLPGCWVARRYETLWFRDLAPGPVPDYNETLPLPGSVVLPDGQCLRVFLTCHEQGESAQAIELDLSLIRKPLSVRSWKPGDRFQPQGMKGRKKVKNFLGDAKVELELRQKQLVLVAEDEILWLIGRRRSALAKVPQGCEQILRVELVP